MSDSSENQSAEKVTDAAATTGESNWYCQIGPSVTNACSGTILGPGALFVVNPTGDATQTYAHASNDGGQTWLPIPNNQVWGLEGSNLQWQLNPLGTEVKFLIGPNS